jgi:hypothetical protein
VGSTCFWIQQIVKVQKPPLLSLLRFSNKWAIVP